MRRGKDLHFVVALLFAGAGGEGVRNMHREHGFVESCEVCVSMLPEHDVWVRCSLFSSRAFSSAILFCVLARSKLRSVLFGC
jgi:hypothetical protein